VSTKEFFVEPYLNWRDLTAGPEFYDMVFACQASCLICAQFGAGTYHKARFWAAFVCLPAQMRSLARLSAEAQKTAKGRTRKRI